VESRPILRPGWGRLLSRSIREIGLLGLISAPFMIAACFEPFNNEQNYSSEDPQTVVEGHLALAQRLGYAILLKDKLATIVAPEADSEANSTVQPKRDWASGRNLRLNDTFFTCIRGRADQVRPSQIDLRALTAAIIGAEEYNRGAVQRRFEFIIAQAVWSVTGFVPNFTFGISQLRLSRARELLSARGFPSSLSDYDVLDILKDDCTVMSLSAQLITTLAANDESEGSDKTVDELVTAVAVQYNGAQAVTESSFLYTEAVRGAYNLVAHPNENDEQGEGEPRTNNKIGFCITFARGEIEGAENVAQELAAAAATSDVPPAVQRSGPPMSVLQPGSAQKLASDPSTLAGGKRVRIRFWIEEPYSKSVVAQLTRARTEWLAANLARQNVPKDRFSVSLLASAEKASELCKGAMPPSTSFAYIEIR